MGVIQRLIKSNWPNTTALKNIRNRKADVPRKLLLLFYIITENAADEEYRETDEDYLTPQQRLDERAGGAELTEGGDGHDKASGGKAQPACGGRRAALVRGRYV